MASFIARGGRVEIAPLAGFAAHGFENSRALPGYTGMWLFRRGQAGPAFKRYTPRLQTHPPRTMIDRACRPNTPGKAWTTLGKLVNEL